MRFNLSNARNWINYFKKNFFDEITEDYTFPRIYLKNDLVDDTYGTTSQYRDGYLIDLNRDLFDNRQLLANTLLHEMIHVFDLDYNGENVSKYRELHGAFWTKIAKIATEAYGSDIGPIQRYSTDKEDSKKDWLEYRHKTKTIRNSYIINLNKHDFIVAKSLTPDQIENISKYNILAIYKAKEYYISNDQNKRVKKYATYEDVIDMLENGVLEDYLVKKPDFSKLDRVWYNYNFDN